MSKTCSVCGKEKLLTEFHERKLSKDGRQSICRDCRKDVHRKHYKANKKKYAMQTKKNRYRLRECINKIKDVPCTDCGNEYPPYVMDFDHVSDDKVDCISRMVNTAMGKATILREIDKCEVVCSNCHRIRTYNRKIFADESTRCGT